MVCQYSSRCSRRLQHFQRTAVKDGAPRLTCLTIDHCTDLRVRKDVAPISHWPTLALRLMQQVAMQHLVQGRESVLFCEIGHPAQAFKGDSLAKDGSCHQQRKGVRRKSIQARADNFAHTGREESTHHHLMLHSCRKVNRPSTIFVRAGGKCAALEQDLERFHQIEGVSFCFSKEPL